jgi:hypothetical protein
MSSALPLHRRAWLYVRAAHLVWNIAATQEYLAEITRAGIADSATQRAWRDRMAAERVELALIQAEIDRHPMSMVATVLVVLLAPAAVGVFGPVLWWALSGG